MSTSPSGYKFADNMNEQEKMRVVLAYEKGIHNNLKRKWNEFRFGSVERANEVKTVMTWLADTFEEIESEDGSLSLNDFIRKGPARHVFNMVRNNFPFSKCEVIVAEAVKLWSDEKDEPARKKRRRKRKDNSME